MDWLNNARSVIELVIALAAVWGIAWRVFRKANAEFEEKIIQTVQEATAQIQVDANGGQSLADVAKGLKSFRAEQTAANERIAGEIASLREVVNRNLTYE